MIACDVRLRQRLIAAAQELAIPDLLIRGADVWNAFTDEVCNVDVAVCSDRIAKVGAWTGPISEGTTVIDAKGAIAVPGYIEPHTHPWPFSNPLSLAEAAVCRGTSCLVYDDSLYHLTLGVARLEEFAAALSAAALPHVFWVARIASQSRFHDEEQVFSREAVERLLQSPDFLGTAEMTRWSDLLDAERSARLLALLENARRMRKFNDGHFAGASGQRLTALATAGIRSCHEAISLEEALDRLRQGIWVILRNSTLRADLVRLLPILETSRFHDRLAYTTDGASEAFIQDHGYIDYLIGIALQAGVSPGIAYRMATLNAATLLRLDEDFGSVAPGRIANVNLLSAFGSPTPEAVVCRGRMMARDQALVVPAPSETFPWATWNAGSEAPMPQWGPEVFVFPPHAPNPFPAGYFTNSAITREVPVGLAPTDRGGLWPAGPDALAVAVTGRGGAWITRGVVRNLAKDLLALASTYTTNAGILIMGKSPEAMAEALARLRRLKGGVALCTTGGEWSEFAFPMAGIHGAGSFAQAAEAARAFQEASRACGYTHADARFTLLFVTGDVLPEVRATEAGWIRVKSGEVLFPAERLADLQQSDAQWTQPPFGN